MAGRKKYSYEPKTVEGKPRPKEVELLPRNANEKDLELIVGCCSDKELAALMRQVCGGETNGPVGEALNTKIRDRCDSSRFANYTLKEFWTSIPNAGLVIRRHMQRGMTVDSLNISAFTQRATKYNLALEANGVGTVTFERYSQSTMRVIPNPDEEFYKKKSTPEFPEFLEGNKPETVKVEALTEKETIEEDEERDLGVDAAIEADLRHGKPQEIEWSLPIKKYQVQIGEDQEPALDLCGLKPARNSGLIYITTIALQIAFFSKFSNGRLDVVPVTGKAKWLLYANGKGITEALLTSRRIIEERLIRKFGRARTLSGMEFARNLADVMREDIGFAKELSTRIGEGLIASQAFSTTKSSDAFVGDMKLITLSKETQYNIALGKKVPKFFFVDVSIDPPQLGMDIERYPKALLEVRSYSPGSSVGQGVLAETLYFGVPYSKAEFQYIGPFLEFTHLGLPATTDLVIMTRDRVMVDYICYQVYCQRIEAARENGTVNDVKKVFIHYLSDAYQTEKDKMFGGGIIIFESEITPKHTLWFPTKRSFQGNNEESMKASSDAYFRTDTKYKKNKRIFLVDLMDVINSTTTMERGGSVLNRLSASIHVYESQWYMEVWPGEYYQEYIEKSEDESTTKKYWKLKMDVKPTKINWHFMTMICYVGEMARLDAWVSRLPLWCRLKRMTERYKVTAIQPYVDFAPIYSLITMDIAGKIPDLSFDGMGYLEDETKVAPLSFEPKKEEVREVQDDMLFGDGGLSEKDMDRLLNDDVDPTV